VIVVAGKLYVEAGARDAYLAGCAQVVTQARQAPGCVDFHLSADPLEPDRINVFEQWESVADVEAFRGSGPSDDQAAVIRSAEVWQHEVAGSTRL
jgi:quinol monooxygenase YgiN